MYPPRDYSKTPFKSGDSYKRKKVSSSGRYERRFVPGYDRTGGAYGRYGAKGGENKWFDTTLTFSFDSTAEVPATGQLCLIPQGVTDVTRVGRKATVKSIQIQGEISFTPGAGATACNHCVLYLILDTQCNGAAATQTDLFTTAAVYDSLPNMNNQGRFTIMKKWVMKMEPKAGASTALNTDKKWIAYYKKCNIPLIWSANTGAITEIRSNNLFLYAGAGTNDDLATMNGVCRLRIDDS